MPEGALLSRTWRAPASMHIILLHRSELGSWQQRALDGWAAANHPDLVYATAEDRVYRLRPPARGE